MTDSFAVIPPGGLFMCEGNLYVKPQSDIRQHPARRNFRHAFRLCPADDVFIGKNSNCEQVGLQNVLEGRKT